MKGYTPLVITTPRHCTAYAAEVNGIHADDGRVLVSYPGTNQYVDTVEFFSDKGACETRCRELLLQTIRKIETFLNKGDNQ
jgi:hypothetical protein